MQSLFMTFLFMAGVGAAASAVLIVAARCFSVPVDERIEAVLERLPGVNCGACGYASCAAAAEGVVKGECGPDVCRIAPAEVSEGIAAVMQVALKGTKRKRAYLCCSRNTAEAGSSFSVNGAENCRSMSMLYGGGKKCTGGCIGYGDCEKVCPVGAISMVNGLPVIDPVTCTGCGICVTICPKNIIALIEDTPSAIDRKRCNEYCVQEGLKFEVDQECCIKCGICYKNCPVDAIVWEKGSPAFIDRERCIECYTCMRLCPPKVIS